MSHNRWHPGLEPIAEVAPGDAIRLETEDGPAGQLTRESRHADAGRIDLGLGHPLTGPLRVQGAEPGHLLEVEFLAYETADFGVTAVIPGFGLSEVFGAREKRILPVDQARISLQVSAKLPGISPGLQAVGAAFEEDLEPSSAAQVLGRFSSGEPAIVENSFGKGSAILIGSFTGLAYERSPSDSTRQFLLSLAHAAGVSPDVEVSGDASNRVEVRRLLSDSSQILLIFNHAASAVETGISVRLPWSASEATNLDSGQTIPLRRTQNGIHFRQTLAGGQILVLRLGGASRRP